MLSSFVRRPLSSPTYSKNIGVPYSFWTRTAAVKSALSPCPRRRIAYIRMCSDMVCYSGTIQGCCTHCHFRNNKPYLSTSAHTVPPPWRKKESFLRDPRPCSFARKEVTHGPLRCADVPLYASGMDSHAHGLSVFPTLVVVGALMLKRRIVHYGSSKQRTR